MNARVEALCGLDRGEGEEMTRKQVTPGDTFLAQSANVDIRARGESGGVVTALLKFLLESGRVDAALAMGKGRDIFDGVPMVIKDPGKITGISGSIQCAPQLLSRYACKYLSGAKDAKIAIVGVGCDAAALQLMAKKGRINLDNVIFIGLNCRGTAPPIKTKALVNKLCHVDPNNVVKEEISKGNIILETRDHEHRELSIEKLKSERSSRRSNCLRCEIKIPRMAAITCGYWGVTGSDAGRYSFVEVCSTVGADILEAAIKAKAVHAKKPSSKSTELRNNIEKSQLALARRWQKHDFKGPVEKDDYWLRQFSKCIKCLGCVKVCPICVCESCKLTGSDVNWFEPNRYPVSPKFHYTRAAHIASDCTGCGQCEDVCPVEIPLSAFYQQSSKEYRELLEKFDRINSTPPR